MVMMIVGGVVFAVGPSAQKRDTTLLGEEERDDSNLRKSVYQE